MTKHVWSLLCRESKIDQDTNNITIIDAYESLQFNMDPSANLPSDQAIGVNLNFEVVSLFFRDKMGAEESVKKTVRVLDPSGSELGKFDYEGAFKSDQNRLRIRIKFNSIAVTTSGTYLFQIYANTGGKHEDKSVATIPLDIKITKNKAE